jgi:hypothetical protein
MSFNSGNMALSRARRSTAYLRTKGPKMETTNQEIIGRAIQLFANAMVPSIEYSLRGSLVEGQTWLDLLRLRDQARGRAVNNITPNDPQSVLRILSEKFGDRGYLFDSAGSREVSSLAQSLRDARNDWAHGNPFDDVATVRILGTSIELLEHFGLFDDAAQIAALQGTTGAESEVRHLAAVTLSVSTIPILSYALAQSRIPIINSIDIQNSGSPILDALLRVTINTANGPLSQPSAQIIAEIVAGESSLQFSSVALDPNLIQQLDEHTTATIKVTLEHDGVVIAEASSIVEALSANQWRRFDNRLALYTLTTFVTPNAPAIQPLIAEAAELLKSRTGSPSWSGYANETPERTDETVRAIFDAIKARGITYILPPASWAGDGQKIRTADEVLVGRTGTCLDTTVVMAAALEQVGIHPLLFILDRHAFLGYWRDEKVLPNLVTSDASEIRALLDRQQIALIETTALCISDDEHTEVSWDEMQQYDIIEYIANPAKFDSAIDVFAVRKTLGIAPMAVRTIDGNGNVVITEYRPNDPAQQNPMSPRERPAGGARADVPPRVRSWKNSLLDLSLRNRLINFGGRNDISLAIPATQLSRVEDIVNAGERLTVLPNDKLNDLQRARGARYAADLPDEDLTSILETQRSVFAAIQEASYLTKLRGLAYRARTIVQETGSNNLYLAFGTLKWKLRDNRELVSPLILVPVHLEAVARGLQYRLVIDDAGESTPNYCLLEKLKQEYDLTIPALENPASDASGIDLDGTFAATREAIAEIDPSFTVEPTVDLSILQFAKFRLWKDLDDNWQNLAQNSLVNHLIYSPTTAFDDPAAPALTQVDLDALGAISPVSADASQLQAVSDAVAGKTFILEGPPGTGKSQTITNMLARSIAEGKKVLFVAEKAEALKVVQKRLDAAGLSAFSLDVHDKSSKPAAVRAQLLAALDNQASVDGASLKAAQISLAAAGRVLTRYAELVHERNGAEFSLYGARQRALAEDATVATLSIPSEFVTSCAEDQLTALRDLFRGLPEVVGGQRLAPNHPWRFAASIPAAVDLAALTQRATDFDQHVDALLAEESLTDLVTAVTTPSHLQRVVNFLQAPPITLKQADRALKDSWRNEADQALAAIARFGDAPHPEIAAVAPQVLTIDLNGLNAQALAADSVGFFSRKRARRAVLAQLAPYLAPGAKVPLGRLSATTTSLAALATAAGELRTQVAQVKGIDVADDWNPLLPEDRKLIVDRVGWLHWAADAFNPNRWEADAPIANALRRRVEAGQATNRSLLPLVTAASASFAALETASSSKQHDLVHWASAKGFFAAWRDSRSTRGTGEELRRTLASWEGLLRHLDLLEQSGLLTARFEILDGDVDPNYADVSFAQGLALVSVTERETTTGLTDFDGISHGHSIDRYRQNLATIREHLPDALPVEILARRTFDANSTNGRIGLLRRELERKRGGLSVRKLLGDFSDVITSITPCIMMSPASVARFFPANPGMFDIVIFDEASQLRVADSVGAMGRGHSVVVVGDSKQMPPTSFAESSATSQGDDEVEDDSTDVVEDQESILTESVQALVPRQMLSWHYRSQDESLIAFSNEHYYKGKLSSFPTPFFGTRDDGVDGYGVSFVRVNGVYQAAGHGKLSQTNEIEAREVVADVVKRFKASPEMWPSLGIVTFNQNQRKQIDAMLRDLRDDRILAALEDDDGIFVKNIETVQGDERDIILFSVGRSAVNGSVPLNFGPLNQNGGERRFNVAVTRARRQVVVFCSFEPGELKAENSASEGLRNLRSYLDFAQRGSDKAGATLARQQIVDLHRDDIAAELRDRGFAVTTDVGLSDFRIDLTVASAEEPGRPVVAVLLDGPRWSERATANDRDALPLDVLSGLMNWPTVDRVWIPEWLLRREDVMERLISSIKSAASGKAQPPPLRSTPVKESAFEAAILAEQEAETEALRRSIDTERAVDPSPPHLDDELGTRYQPWPSRLSGNVTVLDQLPGPQSARRVSAILSEIIEAEGPIHTDRLARLGAAAFGLNKVSAARANAILRQVDRSTIRFAGEPFAWPAGLDPETWAGFRSATGSDPRPIETVNWREIANAMAALCVAGQGMYEEEIKREALAVFGGKRMTEGITTALTAALDQALKTGRLVKRADGLIVAAS